jgi:hypothetical protein
MKELNQKIRLHMPEVICFVVALMIVYITAPGVLQSLINSTGENHIVVADMLWRPLISTKNAVLVISGLGVVWFGLLLITKSMQAREARVPLVSDGLLFIVILAVFLAGTLVMAVLSYLGIVLTFDGLLEVGIPESLAIIITVLVSIVFYRVLAQ